MSTTYSPADSDNAILRKILTSLGGEFRHGDTDNQLLRKILSRLNIFGVDALTGYQLGDTDNNLFRKILIRLSNDNVWLGVSESLPNRPQPADTDAAILRKILFWLNGNLADSAMTPRPGDIRNALLRKFLTSLNSGGAPL